MTVAEMKTRVAVLQAQAEVVTKQEQEALREAVYAGIIPEGMNDPDKISAHFQQGIDKAKSELDKLEVELREMSNNILRLLNELDGPRVLGGTV